MRLKTIAYRGHNPRWSFAPLSGAGAAVHGGRFNPKGVEALYLALSPQGAFLEATQGFSYKFNPLTLCSYDVDCDTILDLTDAAELAAHGVSTAMLQAPWALNLSENTRPQSWRVYDALVSAHAGIVVPSFAHNATPEMKNLVLWRWSEALPLRVSVHDPQGDLPRDQRSWWQ